MPTCARLNILPTTATLYCIHWITDPRLIRESAIVPYAPKRTVNTSWLSHPHQAEGHLPSTEPVPRSATVRIAHYGPLLGEGAQMLARAVKL